MIDWNDGGKLRKRLDIGKLLIRCLFLLSARRLLSRRSLRMRMLHTSLRLGITHILGNSAAVCPAEAHRNPCRMCLIGVRSRTWMHKLVLNHLLQQFLIIRAHVIGFREAIDKLLA